MTQRGIIAAAVLFLVIAGIGGLCLPRQPYYHGKPLTYWWDPPNGVYTLENNKALIAFSGDTLSLIARGIRAKDSQLKLQLVELMSWQRIVSFQVTPAERKRSCAVNAVLVLGDAAKPIIPQLTKALKDGETAREAAVALMGLGIEGFTAVTNVSQSSDAGVRRAVVLSTETLLSFGSKPLQREFVPVLVHGLEDRDADNRALAAYELGRLKQSPALVVPALIRLLHDQDLHARNNAIGALAAFGPDARDAVEELSRYAQSARSDAQKELAIRALRQVSDETPE